MPDMPQPGLLALPPELIAMVLAHVGDRDFCRCLQASALFWPSPLDTTVELRKRRWCGCVDAHDFCATGNTEALALLMERGAPFDKGRCVVNAIIHGHGHRVLDLLCRGGVIDSAVNARDKWRQDVCRKAARLGRLDILVGEWQPHMCTHPIFTGAIQGDSLAAFQWACVARGFGPSAYDIGLMVTSGAVNILRHYRHVPMDDHISWAFMAHTAIIESADIEMVFLCMGDTPSIRAQKEICARLCGRATVRDLDLFYARFPNAFGNSCLLAAAQSRNLDAARWLCQRFPDWNNHFVERLVCLEPVNVMHRQPSEFSGSIKWLCDVALVADVPRLAYVAAERGKTDILVHVVYTALPSTDVPLDENASEQVDRQRRYNETTGKVLSAAVSGALTRFLATGDSTVHDLLVQAGVTAPCLDRIRLGSFRASASFSRDRV
ncbi:hypothetical protein pmac_cds_711 [Pandoravirus macleodensis]|uniref:Ankyrin repeat domain containing protein n=1 Tax=Pandoravirus macleodensis TaxID=2107707 RepID=A0A2U7UFX2_9VIRU|nr:hypothetical protein pmac_cds_711 [Pandoravirus macleodensis]AVK77399.1 hypothetical protein pmac_cds_711 [Pandoravirus macleodensis]